MAMLWIIVCVTILVIAEGEQLAISKREDFTGILSENKAINPGNLLINQKKYMASMNNWLGFSLSPQDHQHPQIGNFTSDEISTAQISGESCFHLPSDSPIPSLNLPAPPFGIMEAFNRNNNHSQGVMIRKITAARAYDLAAMKYWGTTTTTNFPVNE
ncbi:AP2-like ethylene-responsive transcription factor BBM isoform X2 [Salvia miltiorrhiza]|uniref:AP2-like ethylene-responsive transcription factor BBM isoform X2 n=1 Tax=Salvia miltiorrhiza TaxID=226208 RepID=UPI0025AD46F3|nr:AP2-like ethylene-responsive transcription factor BBM isoform X2 [Salvia miltiorrhiza]